MTTPITPDYPDWSPGQVDVAAGVTLFNESVAQDDFNTGQLDTRSLNSVDIWIFSQDASTYNPIAIEALWQVGAFSVGVDYCTVGNGYTDFSSDRQSVISLPCRGDSLTIKGNSAATLATVAMAVSGSARRLDKLKASVPGLDNGSVPTSVIGHVIPAGGSFTMYGGPFTGKANIAIEGSPKLYARAFQPQLIAGVWQFAKLSNQLFATAAGAAMTIEAPGQLIVVILTNSDTVAQNVNCWVTDGG